MELKHQHFAELFRSDFYTIAVVFPAKTGYATEEKEYTYKVPKDLKVSVGDGIVVIVGSDLKVTTVKKIHESAEIHEKNGFNYKWIVGRYDDIMKPYLQNLEKDNKLKIAVGKLEAALARVSLRKRIADAMETLDEASKKELIDLFGPDIQLPQIEK